jgi:hypothetical protein
MKQPIRHSILPLTFILLIAGNVEAQRISFGLYASDNIVLTPLNSGVLNFNDKQSVILSGSTVTINLADNAVAILTIEGQADMDVTLTIDAPTSLDLNVTNTIPLAIRFAYSNTGATTDITAKASAIEVPAGFTSVTFPIKRRTSGLPLPPPTPSHTGYSGPTGTAYLFIYGTLGQVPVNVAAGNYTGSINIHVEYSKY